MTKGSTLPSSDEDEDMEPNQQEPDLTETTSQTPTVPLPRSQRNIARPYSYADQYTLPQHCYGREDVIQNNVIYITILNNYVRYYYYGTLIDTCR